MTRKIDISVTVSWTTPKGGKVEGTRHTNVIETGGGADLSSQLACAGRGAQTSFRQMLALYDEDRNDA